MSNNLPPQVESIINNLLNTRENVYNRSNIRPTLVNIKEAIDIALKKFDAEFDKETLKDRSIKGKSR